ncbi:MAG TPA: hypothetical protein VF638_05190 [Sphingomonas sp.]
MTRVPVTTSALNPAPTLFARIRLLALEDGTPGANVTGTIDWLGALARVTHYGDVNQPGTVAIADVDTGKHAVTDLERRYAAPTGAQLFAVQVQRPISLRSGRPELVGRPA